MPRQPPAIRPNQAELQAARRASTKVRRVYTADETRDHLAAVEGLLKQGLTASQIKHRVTRGTKTSASLGISGHRATVLIARVQETWAAEDQGSRATWKAAQMRRLTEAIIVARGRPTADGRWPDWNHSAVAKYEHELALIQGTHEPLQVNVDVRYTEAMLHVIAAMDPEQMVALIAHADETEALAERYRREHPELLVDSAAEE